MEKLNFSWIIDGEVAGHSEPINCEDLDWLYAKGIRALVRMSQHPGISASEIKKSGLIDLHEPVPDFTAPSQEQLERMTDFMLESVWNKKPVGVSCSAGIGRTGTVLTCFLAKRNFSARGLVLEVRRKRPNSVETDEQMKAIEEFIYNTIKGEGRVEGNKHRDIMRLILDIAEEQRPKYGRGFDHADAVTDLAISIYNGIANLKIFPTFDTDDILLRAAGYLHDIGVPYGEPHNISGFEVLKKRMSKSDIQDVFSNSQRAVILYCVLWHRGTDFNIKTDISLDSQGYWQAKLLASILGIADGLCYPSNRPTKKVSVIQQKDAIYIDACPSKTGDNLYYQVNRANGKKDLLEKLISESRCNASSINVSVRKCLHSNC